MATGEEDKSAAFTQYFTGCIQQGAVATSIAIARQTGLLDVLMGLSEPHTSADIAERAGMKERYVRELLSALAAGKVIDIVNDKATDEPPTFLLPKAHHAGLTSLGAYAEEVPLLSPTMPALVDCFPTDGPPGVPHGEHSGIVGWMAKQSDLSLEKSLISTRIPALELEAPFTEGGVTVLDVGCGGGTAVLLLAAAFPKSVFVGVDLDDDAVTLARSRASDRSLSNAHFLTGDATHLTELRPALRELISTDTFDYALSIDSIHDMPDPTVVMASIRSVLKPSGVFALIDITAKSDVRGNLDSPWAPLLYTVSLMYCMTVSLAAGGIGPGTMWGKDMALNCIKDAGYTVEKEVGLGGFSTGFVCRAP